MNMNISYDEGQFAGIEDIRSSSESSEGGFRLGAATALKKNLSATFEEVESTTATTSSHHPKQVIIAGNRGQSLNQVRHQQPLERPPTTAAAVMATRPPLHTQTSVGSGLGGGRGGGGGVGDLPAGCVQNLHQHQHCQHLRSKRLGVFLRIRPATTSKPHSSRNVATSDASSDDLGTIEILKPNVDPKTDTTTNNSSSVPPVLPTTIRTYPPTLSNSMRINVNRHHVRGGDGAAANSTTYAKEFQFDCVLGPKTSQQTVYATVAAPLIRDLLRSAFQPRSDEKGAAPSQESALIFSYGITNAGKTHTILGDLESKNTATWGIIPRALSHVLDHVRVTDLSSDLYLSFFEIYNEQVYDLLPEEGGKSDIASSSSSSSLWSSNTVAGIPTALKIRECRGQIVVRGLRRRKVRDINHGISLSRLAHNKRHTSSNNLNRDSSRSHFICQMQIVRRYNTVQSTLGSSDDVSVTSNVAGYTTDEEVMVQSKNAKSTIWVVDLAGSERSKRTNVASSARQKESTQINQSLMTLMRCLDGINESGKSGSNNVIPYRESKLTHMFQHHLTCHSASRTAMMVNVNPAVADFDETQHVLAYARKAKLIQMKPEEFSKKRRQHFGDTYDFDGRKKARPEVSKKPALVASATSNHQKKTESFVSRMVKKLSPKRVLKKVPSNRQLKLKSANDGASSGSNFDRSQQLFSSLSSDPTSSKQHQSVSCEDRVTSAALQRSLEQAQAEIARLESENVDLREEMEEKEDQIRAEVAEEMEELLRETRAKHQEKYELLRSQMQQNSNTSRTVNMDKAESQLEELMDKIDECEKEMARLSQSHGEEVASLKAQIQELQNMLDDVVEEKKIVIAELAAFQQEAVQPTASKAVGPAGAPKDEENEDNEDGNDGDEDDDGDENQSLNFRIAPKTKESHIKHRLRKRRRPLNTTTNIGG